MSYTTFKSYLRSFFPSLVFNFRYLPFKQAIKLPILVYKPHFIELGGTVTIDADKISFGMIRLGFLVAPAFPNTGVTWKHEGEIIFKGKCNIGSNSFITTGKRSRIVFGDDFLSNASLKLISEIGVEFGIHHRLGWDCMIMDSNFHPLYDRTKKRFNKAYAPIKIGDYNWIPTQCLIMPGVETPDHCYFTARTILTKRGEFRPYCLHGGSPVKVIKENIERIIGQDIVTEYV